MSQDKDIAIFQRFDDLSMLCLLGLQAEIVKMRKDLFRTCHLDDLQGQINEQAYSGSFKLSREASSDQYQQVVALTKKLQEYCEFNNSPFASVMLIAVVQILLPHKVGDARQTICAIYH